MIFRLKLRPLYVRVIGELDDTEKRQSEVAFFQLAIIIVIIITIIIKQLIFNLFIF